MTTPQYKFDKRVRLRPTPANRQEAVDRIAWGLGLRAEDVSRFGELQYLKNEMSPTGPIYPATDMFGHAFELGVSACNQVLNGHPDGWDALRLGLSYAYFGQLASQYGRRFKGCNYSDPMRRGDSCYFYWLLAVSACPEKVSRPWAHYLYNMTVHEGAKADIGDESMFLFFGVLLAMYCEKRGLQSADLSPKLEGFLPLLTAIGTPQWDSALADYCDYRLSRAYEFPDAKATKAKPGSGYFFNMQWYAIYPLELLALKRIVELQTGQTLSLSIEHPLLHTPLMNTPVIHELPTDALLDQLIGRLSKQYADWWRPQDEIPLVSRL